jgi:hypothetical protein
MKIERQNVVRVQFGFGMKPIEIGRPALQYTSPGHSKLWALVAAVAIAALGGYALAFMH